MAKVAVRDQNKAERHIKKHDEKMIEFIRELSGNMHLLDDETRDRISLISGGIQNRIDAE